MMQHPEAQYPPIWAQEATPHPSIVYPDLIAGFQCTPELGKCFNNVLTNFNLRK